MSLLPTSLKVAVPALAAAALTCSSRQLIEQQGSLLFDKSTAEGWQQASLRDCARVDTAACGCSCIAGLAVEKEMPTAVHVTMLLHAALLAAVATLHTAFLHACCCVPQLCSHAAMPRTCMLLCQLCLHNKTSGSCSPIDQTVHVRTCSRGSTMRSEMSGTMAGRQAETWLGAVRVSAASSSSAPSLTCHFLLSSMASKMTAHS